MTATIALLRTRPAPTAASSVAVASSSGAMTTRQRVVGARQEGGARQLTTGVRRGGGRFPLKDGKAVRMRSRLSETARIGEDRRRLVADGRFVLRGVARAPGAVLFGLRLRDADQRIVEQADLPVVATAEAQPRVLLLGTPNPETKFLRRWAADAGIVLQAQLSVGGGVDLENAPIAITPAALQRFDVVVADERSWATLGPAARVALATAARRGLGLMLRVTGPLPDATRREWAWLGFAGSGGGEAAPVLLADKRSTVREAAEVPKRRLVRIGAADDVPLLRDAAGVIVASWRAEGVGRVAVWPITDSFVMALQGDVPGYGALWSHVFATIARPDRWRFPRQPACTAFMSAQRCAALALPAASQARRGTRRGSSSSRRVAPPTGPRLPVGIFCGAMEQVAASPGPSTCTAPRRCQGFVPRRPGRPRSSWQRAGRRRTRPIPSRAPDRRGPGSWLGSA